MIHLLQLFPSTFINVIIYLYRNKGVWIFQSELIISLSAINKSSPETKSWAVIKVLCIWAPYFAGTMYATSSWEYPCVNMGKHFHFKSDRKWELEVQRVRERGRETLLTRAVMSREERTDSRSWECLEGKRKKMKHKVDKLDRNGWGSLILYS